MEVKVGRGGARAEVEAVLAHELLWFDRRGEDVDLVAEEGEGGVESVSMSFHAAGGGGDGPFPGEDGDFEGGWGVGAVLEEGEAVPRELCGAEVAGEGRVVVEVRSADDGRGGGGVEEKEDGDGEEDDEEEGGAKI